MELNINESKSSIELTRGQKGSYGWKVKVYDPDADKALQETFRLNMELLEKYPDKGEIA